MRWIYTALLVAAMAGCSDAGLTTPAPHQPSPQPLGAFARAPFHDALERIVPALGAGAAVDNLRAALTAVIQDGSDGSLYALDLALDQLITAQPDAAVEADAIRLATIQR